MLSKTILLMLGLSMLLAGGCAAAPAVPSLAESFAGDFLVGAALASEHVQGLRSAEAQLIVRHFNSITPENLLKWQEVRPALDRWEFEPADAFVEFGEEHGMFIVGHTLVWHQQTPAWVFEHADGRSLSRDELLDRMQDHIARLVGRYRGRIQAWDVVNEALADDGSLRDTAWLRIIGPDYIQKAFEFAHAADPAAELYYNDYSLEMPAKLAGALRLVRELQAAGVAIAGIGSQQHLRLETPTIAEVSKSLTDLGSLGIKVMVTELDVSVLKFARPDVGADLDYRETAAPELDPFVAGLPTEMQARLARRYGELFAEYRRQKGSLARVTFWGVTDGGSWLNGWPVPGRTDYPLLFDRDLQPKPAFWSVVQP